MWRALEATFVLAMLQDTTRYHKASAKTYNSASSDVLCVYTLHSGWGESGGPNSSMPYV